MAKQGNAMKKVLQTRYHFLKKYIGIKPRSTLIKNQKRIVIYIYQLQPFDVSWVILDNHSEIQQTVLHGDLTELIVVINQYESHVIIPGQEVLLTQAELPKLTRERLLQALPYAVEEKLIDDISNLHFAIGKSTTHGIPTAIINKEKIETYLQKLSEFGIHPLTMIPATLALPWTQHHWYAYCDDKISIVRTDQFNGFACDKLNLHTLLQLQLLEIPHKPECIHIEYISQTPMNIHLDPIIVNETILSENHFLDKIAILLGANPYINLLQGFYRPKRKSTQTKKIWDLACMTAIAWFSLSLFSNLISFFILHHAKNLTEQEIHQIYYTQFPTATSMVAPRERMESALKKASGNANKNVFLTLLGLLSNAIVNTADIRLLNMNYQEDRLNLTVSASSFNALDTFTESLKKENIKAKQQNATIAGNKVKANIVISKGD
jgi:general secretion pathway protein L